MGMNDSPILDRFSSRLLKDEKILWYGRPAQGLLITPRDFFLIGFFLLWAGGLIVMSMQAQRSSFDALPIIMLLIGACAVFGRFALDIWLRSRLAYALTERRVLISRSGPWSDFKAVRLDRLPQTSLSEDSKGRGTIKFGQTPIWGYGATGAGFWIGALDPTPQFIKIDDARRVFAIIQERSQGSGE